MTRPSPGPLRIAIASDWFPPRAGGVEQQLGELATRLAGRGHQVDVLTTTPGVAEGSGYRVHRLRSARLPGWDVCVSPALPAELSRHLSAGFDVVHAHVSVVSPVGYAAAWTGRLIGLPTVVTFHSVLRAKRLLLRAADVVAGVGRGGVTWTAVSEVVAAQAAWALGRPVQLLSNGIDRASWVVDGRRRAEPGREVTLVSAMRLHGKKRPRVLLDAFAAAARRAGRPARLVIAGDGPERASIERAIGALGLGDGSARVELRGWLSQAALRAAYAEADAFVLPSTREAFGIAALEARAAGLPIVAMRAAGCREFLTHDADALLCEDVAALECALYRLLHDDALCARLAAGGGAVARYDWSAVIDRHEATYRSAMEAPEGAVSR